MGDLAIGDIQVQLVPAPVLLVAFAAFLHTQTGMTRQFCKHLGGGHAPLRLDVATG